MRSLLRACLEMSTDDLIGTLNEWCEYTGTKHRIKLPYPGYDLAGTKDKRVWIFAHTDKRKTNDRIEVLYDPKMQTAWSFEGLGADDRAGVYALIQLYIEMHRKDRPVLVFCDEEESGAHGAREFAKTWKESMSSNCLAMLEFDRRGSKDAVYYNQETKVFKKKVEDYGFVEAYGSFSDISFIGKETLICGSNLSVGYYDQHTAHERLEIRSLYLTIKKGKELIKGIQAEKKQYKMKKWPLTNYSNGHNAHLYNRHDRREWEDEYGGYDSRAYSSAYKDGWRAEVPDKNKEDLMKKWGLSTVQIFHLNSQCHLCNSWLYGAKYDLTTICGRCVKYNIDADKLVNSAMEKLGKTAVKDIIPAGESDVNNTFTRVTYFCESCKTDFPDITEDGIFYGSYCPNCLQPGTEEGYSQGIIKGI